MPASPLFIDNSVIYGSSILSMMVLFSAGVFMPIWLTYDLVWAVAVGGMCSLWAGPGFGVMLASARVASIEEKHTHATIGR